MDIETVSINGQQVPILIGLAARSEGVDHVEQFLVDRDLMVADSRIREGALKELWSRFAGRLVQLAQELNVRTIFAHKRVRDGAFDGYFIYKGLLSVGEHVSTATACAMDDKNKFVYITYGQLVFIDSARIFPVSLEELCSLFNVPGKFGSYNQEFNQVAVLSSDKQLGELLSYNKQDCLALHGAMFAAQTLYIDKYSVDITSIVSTSSLAMKIYRTLYQPVNIPLLPRGVDTFVRKAYYGGATDYYQHRVAEATAIKYYDVNSLYPFAMLQPMPLQFTKETAIESLDNFFGFVEVEVSLPAHVERPLLPVKHDGKTIFPTGTWTATYFSEELKAAKELIPQYEYKFIKGYSFTATTDLFSGYVNDLYTVKQRASGAERWIAKLLLNNLYGSFAYAGP